jgi:hypothetical protein
MLPLDLTLNDYSTNEKIAYLPRKLSEDGSDSFSGEAIGDLCYYAPWGNLAMFYGPYHWSPGLIRRIDCSKPSYLHQRLSIRIRATAENGRQSSRSTSVSVGHCGVNVTISVSA